MKEISLHEFDQVELRVGTILEVEDFPEARKAAFKLKVDFGEEIGIRKSSAQITHHYSKEGLVGMQVIGVVNFPKKQIGPIMSECLITGFYDEDGEVILAIPSKEIKNGAKLG